MIGLQHLKDSVSNAYEKLELAVVQLSNSSLETEEKQYQINFKEAGLLLGDVIDGKNQAIRDSQMKMAMKADYEELHSLENNEKIAKINKNVAEIHVAHAIALLRIAELMEGTSKHE